MTTQRDRLAAVLREVPGHYMNMVVEEPVEGGLWRKTPLAGWLADALLARGVRVVDVDSLAAALRVFIWDQFDGDVDEEDRRQAEEFLAVLDRMGADR